MTCVRLGRPTACVAALGVLGAAQFLRERLPRAAAVPVSVAASGALVGLARRAGTGWDELGLARGRLGRGARYGAPPALVVAAVYAAGAALPATRPLFADARAARTLPGALRQALVDVPLGTVLLEETGFRAVLPALLRERYGARGADVLTAALFGLWHVLPSGALRAANPALARASAGGSEPSRAATAAGNVLVTAAGGLLFGLLRRRGDSVLAPALAHGALNSFGYLAAYTVRRPAEG
ncbi:MULTISPECIES: CPBP family intramembrane glutamic endopeptidase [unclassified Streptomyces]|uniref:CPBP family intramembrane glutamic endopeptidase n=1 Tax=unclassified Streptomyces TaxID=2593676 RepID=UPI0022B5FAF0|nr:MULTISPECIES: CPBP family intramembrane glutamic endopeptidase [unclassified Streptomyces]MCZ7413916.1 CPBP family intramembrane metalloprotease [Streptomyces sp. WMMC897]MCZ7430912.1 CPBP family intramembrane metalloprotease [Streptomyces sp. WMMC1477]